MANPSHAWCSWPAASPAELAAAARVNIDLGAQIIDINMGCPAKKVCNRHCGSALLADEVLVERILNAVVRAVAAPVTLKIRTGTDPMQRNAARIAALAQVMRHSGSRHPWPHAQRYVSRRRRIRHDATARADMSTFR